MDFVTDTHALLWWFTNSPKKIIDSENYIVIPLDIPILQKLVELKDVPELHDKIIVSTANYLNSPLITKDKFLRELPYLKTIW